MASIEWSEEPDPEAAVALEVMVPPEMAMAAKMVPLEPPVPAKAVMNAAMPASASKEGRPAPCRTGVALSQKKT
jgi:hypothetical protein